MGPGMTAVAFGVSTVGFALWMLEPTRLRSTTEANLRSYVTRRKPTLESMLRVNRAILISTACVGALFVVLGLVNVAAELLRH
jgi:hypothetical protein